MPIIALTAILAPKTLSADVKLALPIMSPNMIAMAFEKYCRTLGMAIIGMVLLKAKYSFLDKALVKLGQYLI